ncbi:hypothetical protein LTS18_010560, partial [Coniosporium uncinatum]
MPSSLPRAASPALSSSTSVTGDQPNVTGGAGPVPAKRRRLTPAEKAARDQEKATYKAAKEEEKRVRDEQKRVENEEKEEKRRQREIARQQAEQEKEEKRKAKEAVKQKEEEEKARKERSQMKLNAFFMKPKPSIPAAVLAGSPKKPDGDVAK